MKALQAVGHMDGDWQLDGPGIDLEDPKIREAMHGLGIPVPASQSGE
jgi:hypothetical protein